MIRTFSLLAIALFMLVDTAARADFETAPPADLIQPAPSVWDTERTGGYTVTAQSRQVLQFAVQRQIRRKITKDWAMTMTMNGSSSPDLFIWLDSENEMHKGLKLENGTIAVADGRINFSLVSLEENSPYGVIRVALFDENEKEVASRSFRLLLIPLP